MLSVRQTQLSLFKFLQRRITTSVEVELIDHTDSCMVILVTNYQKSQADAANHVIGHLKKHIFHNKPNVFCYTRNPKEALLAMKKDSCDTMPQGLMPTQVLVLVKWPAETERPLF